MAGEVVPPFKDGTSINTIDRAGLVQQYIRITAGPQRGKYVHTLVAEAKLGRKLRDDEEVDHENGDTFDNEPDNLVVRQISEHAKLTRQRSAQKRAAKRERERERANRMTMRCHFEQLCD